jgi:predicted ATPase
MGEVYRARDPRLERDVAVKVLPEELRHDESRLHRFEREARAAGGLNHPNILTVHDVGTHEDTPFVVTELLEGKTLRRRMKDGELPFGEVVEYAVQVARGLAAAHEKRIVHRDLKPENLFLTRDGLVKILDFGLAKEAPAETPVDRSAETDTLSSRTAPGTVVGTVGYMSPEQVRGHPVDHRSDIFSFGVVLYEMLGGCHPFGADTPADTLAAILTHEPAPLPTLSLGLPQELLAVAERCMEKKREARYPSAREVLEDLRRLLSAGRDVEAPASQPAFLAGRDETVAVERPPFVAREQELAKLNGHLDQALAGQGRVAFVTGEAGSGKTSLVHEFVRRIQQAHSDLVVASGNCNAHTGLGDPYLPFREVFAQLTGDIEARWRAGAISREHTLRLWRHLPFAVTALLKQGPELIDVLVSGEELLARAQAYAPTGADWLANLEKLVERRRVTGGGTSAQQSGLFEQCARVFETLAQRKPLVLVLDNLQWADAGSTGLLLQLAERLEGWRVLIVGAYRPEEVAEGRDGERHPLRAVIHACTSRFGETGVEVGAEGGETFVEAVVDMEPNRLGRAFRDALYEQTQGHSLYTVELMRGMREQGALVRDEQGQWIEREGLDWETLPPRLEAMIGERLERLPDTLREVLRLASVEGEVFTAEVLARVKKSDPGALVHTLSSELGQRHQLVRAQDIRRMDGGRLSSYRFRHILFQRYLYGGIDRVERSYLHEEMAGALEELYGERAGEIAVQLARHFEEAELTAKAIGYLQQAGGGALRRSANQEAAVLARRALGLLEKLPASAERIGQEIALQQLLGMARMFIAGYSDPIAGKAMARARDLCRQVGDVPQLGFTIGLLWGFHFTRAEYEPSLELSAQILRLAPQAEDPSLLFQAGHNAEAGNRTMLGEPERGLQHAEQALAHYDPERHRLSAFQTLQDIKPTAMSWASLAQWLLGYPDRAAATIENAIEYARGLEHPYTLSFPLMYAVILSYLRRDRPALERFIEEERRLCSEYGYQLWLAMLMRSQGWVLAQRGEAEHGVALLRESLATREALGARVFETGDYVMLSQAYTRANRTTEALDTITNGLGFAASAGERFYEAELHRLGGEVQLTMKRSEEAERSFEKAIDVARAQGARSFELRATTSLARLWKDQGKKEDAQRRLAAIYGWFTEGFDTPDLVEAKALLDDLTT